MRDHGTILHHVANGFAEGADRQDLMQELMLAVWKSIPSFRAEAQPSTYIYRVAHHAALTWKRRERNYQRRVEQSESLVAQDGPDALPALRTAAARRIDIARTLTAGVDRGLSQPPIGQRVAEANIHVLTSPRTGYHRPNPNENASQ